MARHLSIGRLGEKLAKEFLEKRKFTILHQNWKHQHWEIDIIATRGEVLHFVEVKTRKSLRFGYPESDVTRKKLHYIIKAAEEFQFQNPEWRRIQFDVLSIILHDNDEEYFFIEDVYV